MNLLLQIIILQTLKLFAYGGYLVRNKLCNEFNSVPHLYACLEQKRDDDRNLYVELWCGHSAQRAKEMQNSEGCCV